MSSQVVRIQSFSKGSLASIGREVERTKEDLQENRNEDIDKNRTHLNEFFIHTEGGMYGKWKDVCKKLNVTNTNIRKNATAFEGMIITSDQEFFKNLGYVAGDEPTPAVRNFFNKAYEFALKEIGFKGTDENILSACVHYDETTPHLQLYYIPIIDSWKEKVLLKDEQGKIIRNGNGSPVQARDKDNKLVWKSITDSEVRKISRDSFWKNKGGNKSYTQMQDRFYNQISKNVGLGRGEIGSTREHTTKQEWQAQKIDRELAEKQKKLSSQEKKIEKIKSELEYSKDGQIIVPTKEKIRDIQNQNRALKIEINKAQRTIKEQQEELDKLKTAEQTRQDALKDRNSITRRSLDALDKQTIYDAYIKRAKEKIKGLGKILKPVEDMINKTVEYGSNLDEHKRQYVYAKERIKMLEKEIKSSYDSKSSLSAILDDIKRNSNKLNGLRSKLNELQNEKANLSLLSPKQLSLNKEIKILNKEIVDILKILEDYNMKNCTDSAAIADEIRYYEREIEKYNCKIDKDSNLLKELSLAAKEHLEQYKSMKKLQSTQEEPVKNIIDRYDNEYEVPAEYIIDFNNRHHKAIKEKTNDMEYWQSLINKAKENNQRPAQEKNIHRNQGRSR